ncbi:MAG TPA: cyclase family protein [Candidatus Limnocylindrales bacterium]|nr:cyclase family protein [Candidatus Limnocylindrales bacterium]
MTDGVRYVLLSHLLRGGAPVWPGNAPAAEVELVESIARGEPANMSRLVLQSHSGTHVDSPWHFNPDGPAAWQLPIAAFVFDAPALVDVPKRDGGFITTADLEPHATAFERADIAFLATGWGRHRGTDGERYANAGPLLHPDAARWLIDTHPGLRAIATDAISIGSPRERAASVETHRVLTGVGRSDGRFVLIYEDVRIVPEVGRARRVFGWPLLVEGADGSPVTLVAEIPEES